MADQLEHAAPTAQHEQDVSEEIVEINELLGEDADRHQEQGEAASNHSSPRERISRPHEDGAGHTTPPCSPGIHAPPRTFRCWHESNQTSEIWDFICDSTQPPALESQLFMPEDADCGAWVSPSNPKCPASFGDHGTTATAGAFGQLVQFSDYLGAGNSGMFSAGHCNTAEPYLVIKRARDLHSHVSDPFEQAHGRIYSDVFGLKFLNLALLDDARPSLKWFQYQWPRYEYKRGCFKEMENIELTIQFIVRNKTVFQQCILENRGETDVDLHFAFCKGTIISDLDHVTDDYEFNKTTANDQNAGPGPGGVGWVQVSRFSEESPDGRTDSQHSSHDTKSNSSHENHNEKDQTNHGVALVVSMTVNGKMVVFPPGQLPRRFKETLKAKSSALGHKGQVLEIVTAYKLVLLADPLSDWKRFIIPLKEMKPSRFLREAKAGQLFRISITKISGKDGLDYSHGERGSEIPKNKEKEAEADIVEVAQDEFVTVDNQPQNEPSPAIHRDSTPEKTSPIMDHIEFSVRRNLEHILGVCAIPVTVHVSREVAEGQIWEKLRDVEAIALSCGDLSGHRVCTTSSFFAFQFLTEVAKRLSRLPPPDRDDTHVQALLSRIRDVCLGHLKWLYAAQEAGEYQGFDPLYWVSGEKVNVPKSSRTWAPLGNVRYTAFHILKVMEFANSINDAEDCDSSLFGEIISLWGWDFVRWLERLDSREDLTWHHKRVETLRVFRLDDHVWIWRALKAMEDDRLGAWAILCDRAQCSDRSSSTDSEAPDADEILRCRRRFSSRTVQREVLLKFTTEHQILQKNVVALTRSPQETRFLFHARDTALLYGQDMGFFPEDASIREAWENTIDSQRLHENNQEARWNNALRYALSIMLGIRGRQINNREPGHMVQAAAEVLLRSSSEDGLFPGKLDIMTKGPLEDVFHKEEDSESYYEAGFEIPYVFLIHAMEIGAVVDGAAEPALETASGEVNLRHHPTVETPNSTAAIPAHHSNPNGQADQRESDAELRKLLVKLSDVLSARPFLPNTTSPSDRTGSKELVVDARLALKKAIPLGNIVDSHNIVEIEDEWLFDYPEFFDEEEHIDIDETLDSLKDFKVSWLKNIDVAEMRRKYSSHNKEDGRADTQSEASSSSMITQSSITFRGPGDSGLRVRDVPSRKRIRGKGVENFSDHLGSFDYIWDQISRPRTVATAKKRLIGWSRRDTGLGLEAALLCYAVSNGEERENMLDFFERHFRHENFIFDYCNLAQNNWETEVHVSFFILEDASGPLSDTTARQFERLPGAQGMHIFRGSIGFRFHGDVFDRYWTYHQFDNIDLESLVATEDAYFRLLSNNESLMFQRKVLELLCFSGTLSQVESNTKKILTEVKSGMGIRSGAFSWSIPSMDKYSSWSKLWEGFAPLLQALVDDLTSTQDVIAQWETREDDRGQERPRWTHNREKKYRAEILRLQRVLQWRKKGIQDLLHDVESLRDACTSRLANAREELSFRSSQNIASFTYVTIVFLPLGFAASVFSMNGYPSSSWVAGMAVIAVITLAITVTALANTKLLLAVAEKLSRDALRITGAVFQSSLIGKEKQRQRDERAQASHEQNKPAYQGDRKGSDPLQNHATRHVLFWMAYLLIELPARRVALACRALPASLMLSLGLSRPDATPPPAVDSTDGTSGPPDPAPPPAFGRKFVRITGGILILPLLLISWTIQLLFYNVLDIVIFLGRLTRKTFYALVSPSDANGLTTDTKMVTWLIDPPPSLRPVRKFMSRDEKSEKLPPQADTTVSPDRSNSGSLEEV